MYKVKKVCPKCQENLEFELADGDFGKSNDYPLAMRWNLNPSVVREVFNQETMAEFCHAMAMPIRILSNDLHENLKKTNTKADYEQRGMDILFFLRPGSMEKTAKIVSTP